MTVSAEMQFPDVPVFERTTVRASTGPWRGYRVDEPLVRYAMRDERSLQQDLGGMGLSLRGAPGSVVMDTLDAGGPVYAPPSALNPLHELIDRSRWILGLGDDWDDEGSSGYREDTWSRATEFLASHADAAYQMIGLPLPLPTISPAQDGSIDLYWEVDGRTLMINFTSDPAERPAFYGKSRSGDKIAGEVAVGTIRHDLVAWLTRIR